MKIKRILFLMFALCLVFALVSCNIGSDSGRDPVSGACSHNWASPYLIREATCEEGALSAKQCTKCKEIEEFTSSEPLGHDLDITGEEATCTEGGYRDEVCRRCDYEKHESLPAGHNFGENEWFLVSEPTEDCDGEMRRLCTVCHSGISHTLPELNDTDYEVETVDEYTAVYTYNYDGASFDIVASDFKFRLLEGEDTPFNFDVYILTGYEGTKSDIVLSSTYKGCPVIAVDSFAFWNSALTSVVIPEPTFTFTRDDLAIDVPLDEFPEGEVMYLGYQSIGSNAFLGCSSLTSVALPDSVTSISYDAFMDCSELGQVNLEDVKSIGTRAFAGCTSLSDLDLSGATHIGERAFCDCSALDSLLFDDALTEIGDWAFENCTALVEVVLPNSVETVGSAIFLGCTGIEEITLSRIFWGSFASLFSGQHYYGDTYYSGVDASKVPAINTVTVTIETSVPDSAFRECALIKKVVLPATTMSIGEHAFRGCSALETVVGCDEVMIIGEYAFANCYNLDDFYLSNSVHSIGRYAFEGVNAFNFNQDFDNKTYYIGSETNPYLYLLCGDATSVSGEYSHVEVRDGCRFIATNAFGLCNEMTAITIPASVEHLGVISTKSYISNNQTLEIYYDGTAERFTELSFSCSGWYLRLFVPNGNEWVEVTDLTVSDNLTEIPDGAYAYFINIETIRIPEGVVSIGLRALGFNNLKNIYLPKSITSIGGSAFYSSELENVYYYGTIEDWCNIAFGSEGETPASQPMSFAEHFYMLDSENEWAEVTEITVPDTVTEISEYLFLGFDNLEKLVIHEGVTKIYTSSYYDCELLTIYYEGTKEQWESILSSGWVYGNPVEDTARRAYYSDEAPTVADILAAPELVLWHYNDEDEVEEWSAVTNYADGKTYVYTSTTVSVSDEYWSYITLLKDSNSLDQAGFTQEEIEVLNSCATKADYEAYLSESFTNDVYYAGLTVSFANSQITLSQGDQSGSPINYVEIDGEIYQLATNAKWFTVDTENNRLVETVTDIDGFVTATHYYNEVVAE